MPCTTSCRGILFLLTLTGDADEVLIVGCPYPRLHTCGVFLALGCLAKCSEFIIFQHVVCSHLLLCAVPVLSLSNCALSALRPLPGLGPHTKKMACTWNSSHCLSGFVRVRVSVYGVHRERECHGSEVINLKRSPDCGNSALRRGCGAACSALASGIFRFFSVRSCSLSG